MLEKLTLSKIVEENQQTLDPTARSEKRPDTWQPPVHAGHH